MKKRPSLLSFILFTVSLCVPLVTSAGSLTNYAENAFVDHIFRGLAYSATTPANYYIALYTGACSDSAAGTEVTGGSYSRVSIARSTSAWTGTHGTITGASSGTNGTVGNAAAVAFPAATADWGTVSHWGVSDAPTGGNLVICAPLTATRTITNGSTPSFAPGALNVQLDTD